MSISLLAAFLCFYGKTLVSIFFRFFGKSCALNWSKDQQLRLTQLATSFLRRMIYCSERQRSENINHRNISISLWDRELQLIETESIDGFLRRFLRRTLTNPWHLSWETTAPIHKNISLHYQLIDWVGQECKSLAFDGRQKCGQVNFRCRLTCWPLGTLLLFPQPIPSGWMNSGPKLETSWLCLRDESLRKVGQVQ